jgi:hypothetical protein
MPQEIPERPHSRLLVKMSLANYLISITRLYASLRCVFHQILISRIDLEVFNGIISAAGALQVRAVRLAEDDMKMVVEKIIIRLNVLPLPLPKSSSSIETLPMRGKILKRLNKRLLRSLISQCQSHKCRLHRHLRRGI